MGKPPYMYTDSETEETSASSASENVKKKKKFSLKNYCSILKYTNGNVKKKKCKAHSKSEPDDSDYRNRSRSKVKYKLPGILKHSKEEPPRDSSDEEEDIEPVAKPYSQSRYLVGRVPRPAGAKPGRGGGVAIIVKKNVSNIPPSQISTTSAKRTKSSTRRLSKKRSY
ncbi:uncharacterized protein LOC142982933 isoform X2 [Anticarsia gemmatalis]|uniref:uncharacterized protein LOC142982933 isoform X2 n=1 Tax=Anticarsia gemmatalis TaxID=129554 RepID=UPI003F7581B4